MKFDFKDKNEYIRLIKFGFVGVFNTAVDWVAFFLLNTLAGAPIVLSQVVAYACGVVSSYIGNKFFTFKAKNKVTVKESVKFIAVNIISLGISTLVLVLLKDKLGWNEYVAKIPATLLAMAVNFLGSRFFVFAENIDKKQ